MQIQWRCFSFEGKGALPRKNKWKMIEMKKNGYLNRIIMETLGIENYSKIKKWVNWCHTEQSYCFQQPVGKQYPHEKGPKELSELEQLR